MKNIVDWLQRIWQHIFGSLSPFVIQKAYMGIAAPHVSLLPPWWYSYFCFVCVYGWWFPAPSNAQNSTSSLFIHLRPFLHSGTPRHFCVTQRIVAHVMLWSIFLMPSIELIKLVCKASPPKSDAFKKEL